MTQVSITSAALSDVGHRRKENQDNYLVTDGLFLVADGMGGGVSGQAASAMALEKFGALATQSTRTKAGIGECFAQAQLTVRALGDQQGAVAGTTLTGLVLKDLTCLDADANSWYVVNVGDSRTYHLSPSTTPDGWDASSFLQITHDHSERQEAIDSGRMLPEVANRVVPRNIITQAIGSPNGISPDYFQADLIGRFVVCSDGVHSELADTGIAAVASLALPPGDIAHRLVDSALEAGGHDNITVVVVDVLPRKTSPTDTNTGDTLARGTVKEWSMSVIGPNEDIDSLNDSTLETLRTTQAQDNGD